MALAPLLDDLRSNPALEEIRPAEFLLDGRPFLHFHEGVHGVTADVLLAKRRVSMPATSASEQAELLDQVYEALAAIDSRARDRLRRPHRRC
ncbi:MAG TPA: hypothetical protein VH741_01205 [Candidatus Limnocylindrales bacterium]